MKYLLLVLCLGLVSCGSEWGDCTDCDLTPGTATTEDGGYVPMGSEEDPSVIVNVVVINGVVVSVNGVNVNTINGEPDPVIPPPPVCVDAGTPILTVDAGTPPKPDAGIPPPPACGPQTCSGCCYNGACQPGTTTASCGGAGCYCTKCSTGQTCTNKACVTPSPACGPQSCTGCCSGGVCQAGTALATCGASGSQCKVCNNTTQTCTNKVCATKPPTCGGCWYDNKCCTKVCVKWEKEYKCGYKHTHTSKCKYANKCYKEAYQCKSN